MADVLPEKWMKVMAVTTTVLAVVASVAASRASLYISKAQLLTAIEEDQWSYYQAKSIKQDLFVMQQMSLQIDRAGVTAPGQKGLLDEAIKDSSRNIARYDQEKADIKKKADSIHQENVLVLKRGVPFSLAVVFAQIGIMLSAVGLLLIRREMWAMGLVMGIIAIFFIADGFLLFY